MKLSLFSVALIVVLSAFAQKAFAENPFSGLAGSYSLSGLPITSNWNMSECNPMNLLGATSLTILKSAQGTELYSLEVHSTVNGRDSIAQELLGNYDCGTECYYKSSTQIGLYDPTRVSITSAFVPNGRASRYTRAVEIERVNGVYHLWLNNVSFTEQGEKDGLCTATVQINKLN